MDKSIDKITNVLIFKDGFYYLTILANVSRIYPNSEQLYSVIEQNVFHLYGIERNGFEFASDAYSYLSHLQHKEKV